MKRTLLDITNVISRNVKTAYLIPYNLLDETFSIWIAKNYRYSQINREVEYRVEQSRLRIRINTQEINPVDFIAEQISEGLLIKFKKSNFEYSLDAQDQIILTGDLENYA